MHLQNKTILITGSTDGLGRLLAIELAKKGANIIVTGRDKTKTDLVLQELATANAQGKHTSIMCDLNKPETVAEAFESVEQLDVLVNCAGVWAEGNTIDIKPERIIELVNVNLSSYMLVFRTLLPKLLASTYGQLLNVVSVAGYEIPAGYFHTVYSASKYGLQGFTEATAKEFENKNLRVMGFYPGGMETAFFTKAGEDYDKHEPWMFDPMESVEAIIFMLTRNEKINIKRLDLINHLQQ